jgi:uncharacterized protein (DUF1499 family)
MIEALATGAVAPGRGVLALARRWSLAAAVCLLAAVPLVLLFGPAAYRLKLMSLEAAMWGLSQVALWLCIGALIAAVIVVITHGVQAPRRGVIIGIAVLTFGGLALGRLGLMPDARTDLPPVWDSQTDWAHPIVFSSQTITERESAGAAPVRDDVVISSGVWAGKTVDEAQRQYYAAGKAEYYALKTMKVPSDPAATRAAALRAIHDQGWTLKPGSDQPGVNIEATNTSRWYGLVSDIVVRVEPDSRGSRIDVRSTSRTATPDMGANANRVKDLLDALKLSLRPEDEKGPGVLE